MTPAEKARSIADALLQPDAGLLDRVAEAVADVCDPQDIFSREQLEQWAKLAGFTPPAAP